MIKAMGARTLRDGMRQGRFVVQDERRQGEGARRGGMQGEMQDGFGVASHWHSL